MTKKYSILIWLLFAVLFFGPLLRNLDAEVRVVVVHDRNLFIVDEHGNHLRPITNTVQYPKWEPRFSPDGKLIAFYANMGERTELWIINYEGTALWPLTSYDTPNAAYGDGGPAWSADGTWVYFGSGAGGDCEVWRKRLDKTALQQLTEIPGQNTQSFDISPAAPVSVFVRGAQGNGWSNQMFLDNLNFDSPVPIQANGAPHRPRISPDGQSIAYTYWSGSWDTHVIKIDGTGDRLILQDASPVCWHPNGQSILVCRNEALYWVDLDTLAMRYLANGWAASAYNKLLFSSTAGENIIINSDEVPTTTLLGSVTIIEELQNSLSYRWREGSNVLCDWMGVDSENSCPLSLSNLPLLVGAHLLSLDVTDGTDTSSDDMILTIENSVPHAAAEGGGVFESPATISLGGSASDYDGDILSYKWLENDTLLYAGLVQSNIGGDPVHLPILYTQISSLGLHILRLEVSDGINSTVTSEVTVRIIDTTAPTLSPVASSTILWPPNHQLVDISINARAFDSQGGIRFAAMITSNEPQEGAGDGDMAPDMTPPIIEEASGIIRFQLRAERSGLGNGRTYTVIITATDPSNNTSSAALEIIVPHDKRR